MCVFKGFYEILEAMGMASMNSSGESLKLCVFDLRRGQNEGQELDKILFFYPPDVTFSTQLSVIGLSEGLITFTRSVSRDSFLSDVHWFVSLWIMFTSFMEFKNADFSPQRQLVRL